MTPSFDVREVIRDHLIASKDEADITKVVTEVIALIPSGDVVDYLVRYAVHQLATLELREVRRPSAKGIGRGAASQWDHHHLVVPDLGAFIRIDGIHKALAICTADDLEIWAETQIEQGEKLLFKGKRAREVATEMRAAGAATVSDLYNADVEKLAA